MEDFIHLHVHTHYSILDGQSKVANLVKKAVGDGMRGMAITDHGVMYGVKELADCCAKVNKERKAEGLEPFKPIFGCEMYVARRRKEDKVKEMGDMSGYHLIVLAKNYNGYKNLIKLVSRAWVNGYYYKPRTDRADLERYHEGLIVCSACIAGEVPRKILDGDLEGAREAAQWYHDLFGDDYYLELQRHEVKDPSVVANRETFPLQQRANRELIRLAKELGIKLVCTNDCHFENRETAEAHDHLLCLSTQEDLDDPNRMRMTGSEFYMKTEEEMRAMFPYCPEACDNTLEIADKCYVELDWDSIILPRFPLLDPGETHESQFRRECEKGLRQHYGDDWATREIGGVNIKERFEYEYKVICDKGFAAYFLIVAEYVQWAKDNGIGVGPGRGSAAGAIVAYAMNITAFDPLENGLMFERFLSPQRTEMPDIDMDFDDERRLEVVEHVRQLYGPEKVTHVITYSTIKAKQAINDGLQVDIDRAVVIEEKSFGSCFQSADQQEGMGAFLEKRKHEPFINK